MDTNEFPAGNPRVRWRAIETLSDHWYVLRRALFSYQRSDGRWTDQVREVYDRGNGVAILPIDRTSGTVVLIRQFRAPAYLNGHRDGMLLEVPAGLDDREDPALAARRELAEETGYVVDRVERLFSLYMSPGAVTEHIAFYVADIDESMRLGEGGGTADEGEDIEVVHLSLADAWQRVERGEIVDAKTVVLLQWALGALSSD